MFSMLNVEFDMEKVIEAVTRVVSERAFDISKLEKKNYYNYIRIMAEIEWPAFLDGDFDFHEQIVELYDKGLFEEIEEAIYSHYDAIYIKDLQDQLEASSVIKEGRIPILKEAFLLYHLGYFYGSVTLMMSQIIGMVKDIEDHLIQTGSAYKSQNEELLSTRYRVSKKSEKGKTIATLLEGKDKNDEQGEYLYLIGYFRNKIFSNKLEVGDLTTQVNRNMIFHGEQLTFGTKEQALKLILCIDSLCWIAEVLHNKD